MIDFDSFLSEYKNKLAKIFKKEHETNGDALERGISQEKLSEILMSTPLASFIPAEHGGFGGHTAEALSMLEASSYESLPLSLMMGINGAFIFATIS